MWAPKLIRVIEKDVKQTLNIALILETKPTKKQVKFKFTPECKLAVGCTLQ